VARTRSIIAVLVFIIALLAGALLAQSHRQQIAWNYGDDNPNLAFDRGGVAIYANGQSATGDEQHSIDMLDMSLEKIRRVYYKPVDESALLRGERQGIIEYLKSKHVSAQLPEVDVASNAPVNLVDSQANMFLATALHKYGAQATQGHLTFATIAGAPNALVMTSGNRSSEPIAYDDDDATRRLSGIADAFLRGEREIARRVDDSVARADAWNVAVLRHGRGYAPRSVANLPSDRPILAVGGDLKNAISLVVGGNAFISQHIGDLTHFAARGAFEETVSDLCAMYEMTPDSLFVAHDAHPQYLSTSHANELAGNHLAVQHHRAHIASVLAERGEWDRDIIGVAFDGTGYGDDGTIWGGEIFTGSLRSGLERTMHLRNALLPGGDAAARHPVQCAAGFLAQLDRLPNLHAPPFDFPPRYRHARALLARNVRCFATTSVGRLFDAVAALCGFTREITFEGQAAMWLEHLASETDRAANYHLPVFEGKLDFRPVLEAVVEDRARGRRVAEIARGFHIALADAVLDAANILGNSQVVASGGVFQNRLLSDLMQERFGDRLWLNAKVPCNDGGICLGQAAIASTRAL